ncbi:gamma-tubulin complex component 6 isoform X3 [Carcharodon carcharias]|nr:gamma-tubulin complex component 6 isoform X3 [Carcharodon carcharias]XP_041058057.1 gamma-tubulin complex component 6 isoform X3 [Carcharodon carcharias]XP_041058058.1 gamma-tubulin complex component 6 isoform X3 [Carcharodon carcharias]XP_041058059.1 gamma-tubulin complex component 6 isoform X3 [Carcharodon carcharias]XP_041058060.1 gamma-tubulin complex component 6 isoform X3 [Carcharodon carcharias]XP_041058061.1 gamma-tubulin complex component 6 isoform X3 [Carcharodon carcharias]
MSDISEMPMASITQLFGDLCEAQMTGLSWKCYLGKRRLNRKQFKEKLKRVVYNTLFVNLFRDEATPKSQSDISKLPVKNKILMLSFNLRVAGMDIEADRLEDLTEKLEKSTCMPQTDLNSVLKLLIELAGTGPYQLQPQKRDYFLNNKNVGRNVKLQGYDHYDASLFESGLVSFISNEDLQFHDNVQRTLHLMDAKPGTGLPGIGLFSHNYLAGDKYEKDTRVSLFGALVGSRTCEMEIKLDLPAVPDNVDITGLKIRVPQSIDQSEDEGFQSASNLTPDSQSEPSTSPDIDLWNAVLTYEPSKYRCWELIGCPPGKKEEPYLTEAGREAFNKFYRLRESELQLISGTLLQPTPAILQKESELVKDVLNVLIGVASMTFSLNQSLQAFIVKQGVYVSGTSPESMYNLLSELAENGTYYTRLSHFSLQPILDSTYNKGLVFQAFTSGLRKYLQYYRACVLSTPPSLSLLPIVFLFRKLGRQLRYLSELCGIGSGALGINQGSSLPFPTGVKLLSYLYKEALNNCSNEHYPVLLSLLKSSCEPYTRFVYDWVYSGICRDAYGEFMIQVNEDYLNFRDKHYWTNGYVLASKEVEECVPLFLAHVAYDIYICGKTINLLKLCCPTHYICWSDIPVPCISVTFSLEELEEIERDSALYVSRMERIARYNSISREAENLRKEIAQQELIVQAQRTATRAMATFKNNQIAERKAFDVKKREQFLELKEQMEKDIERRNAVKQHETENDLMQIRVLREREEKRKAQEEELERRARQQLIEHYSNLSEEAARREQRALWKIQRHKLETARTDFLRNDQKKLQALLEKLPLGEQRGKSDVIPGFDLQHHEPLNKGFDSQELSFEVASYENRILSKKENLLAPVNEIASNIVAQADLSSFQEGHEQSKTQIYKLEPGLEAPLDVDSQYLPHSSNPSQKEVSLLDISFEDFLPMGQQQPGAALETVKQTTTVLDVALKEIGSELSDEKKSIAVNKDECEFNISSAESRGSHDKISQGKKLSQVDSRMPQWNVHGHDSKSCIKTEGYTSNSKPSDPHTNIYGSMPYSNLNVSEYVSNVGPARPRWSVHGHASESNIQVGECVSNVEPSRPRWNIHGHVAKGNIQVGEHVSDIEQSWPQANIHGHASRANIQVGEYVSDMEQSWPQANIHGHASRANIQVGEYVSDMEQSWPQANIHGHASRANIQVGEYVSDIEQSWPQANIHGHASRANIQVGEYVSDIEQSWPQANIHGHASRANIQVGEYVSDIEQSWPQANIHGHASRANIQIGEYVSNVEPYRARWNIHGHVSQANIQLGKNVSNKQPCGLQWNIRSESSQPLIKVGQSVSDVESPVLGWTSFAHPSQSNFRIGEWSPDVEANLIPRQKPCVGPSSGSIIQDILYNNESGVERVVLDKSDVQQNANILHTIIPEEKIETTEKSKLVTVLPSPELELNGNQSKDKDESQGTCENDICGRSSENTSPQPLQTTCFQDENKDPLGLQSVRFQERNEHDTDSTVQVRMDSATDLLSFAMEPVQEAAIENDTWKKEQAYLKSLADQYCVEHYQDNYELMSEPPITHLLQNVMTEPYLLPLDPSVRRATDATAVQASSLISLPVLMKHSITAPLIAHASLVNKAIIDYLFVELNIEQNFEALRHFLLMEDGEFAQSLSDLLFEKLGSGQTPGELLNPLVLNSILNKALQYSLHGDSKLASNLTFALKYLPEMFKPNAPDALNCLELRYKVNWPLNIVITESCMSKYNKIFSFLLQLKHMFWTLKDVWFHLKRTALVNRSSNSVQFHQLQLYRHEMQHFVKVIQGYIANQILHVTWCEFGHKLSSVGNLDELHRTHAEYLNKGIFRGLLTEKAAPVMNIIHNIFSLILKFRSQLISQAWQYDADKQVTIHPNFAVMQQSYKTFKHYSHFLFKVVTKLVNRGYQPHLEDFLLRINFNNYYLDV